MEHISSSLLGFKSVFLFKTRKDRNTYERSIFPTTSTNNLICKHCTLPFHKSKCPFPDPDKDIPAELLKFIVKSDTSVKGTVTNGNNNSNKSYADAVSNRTPSTDLSSPLNNRDTLSKIAALEAELKTERYRNNLLTTFFDSDQQAIEKTTMMLHVSCKKVSDTERENQRLLSENLDLQNKISNLLHSNIDVEQSYVTNIETISNSLKSLASENEELKRKLDSPQMDLCLKMSAELNVQKSDIDKQLKDLQVERFELNNTIKSIKDREIKVVKLLEFVNKQQATLKHELSILHTAQEEVNTKEQLRTEWELTCRQEVHLYSSQVNEKNREIHILKSNIFTKENEIKFLKNQVKSLKPTLELDDQQQTPKSKKSTSADDSSTFKPTLTTGLSSSKFQSKSKLFMENGSEINFNSAQRKTNLSHNSSASSLPSTTRESYDTSLLTPYKAKETSVANIDSNTTGGKLALKLQNLKQSFSKDNNQIETYLTHTPDNSNSLSSSPDNGGH